MTNKIIVIDTENLKSFEKVFDEIEISSNDIIYYFKDPNTGKDITRHEKEILEQLNIRLIYKNVSSPSGSIDFEITAFIISLIHKGKSNIILVSRNKSYRLLRNTLKSELNTEINIIMLDNCIKREFERSDVVNNVCEKYNINNRKQFIKILYNCNNILALNKILSQQFKDDGVKIFHDIKDEFKRVWNIDDNKFLNDDILLELNSVINISDSVDSFLHILYEHFRGDSLRILKYMEIELKNLILKETGEI